MERAKTLMSEFPNSIITFATLKDSLIEKEKRLLRPLVNMGRRRRRQGQPYSPILVLTATELLSKGRPPKWLDERRSCGGDESRLIQYCEMTQQRYLDMMDYCEWAKERRKKLGE